LPTGRQTPHRPALLTVNENFITLNSKQVALQAERLGGARVCGFTLAVI